MEHRIPHRSAEFAATCDWNSPEWSAAPALEIANHWPTPHGFRPRVALRLQWTDAALHGIFRVEDEHVLARATAFNELVCRDSCVEIFVEPLGGVGYCNFEFNPCGVKHISHVRDPRRRPKELGGFFYDFDFWTPSEGDQVAVAHSIDGPVTEERVGPCVWTLGFRIPFATLLAHTGGPLPRAGAVWRFNAYKCGDDLSVPHWVSWNPVDTLNFHNPKCFGELLFVG